MSLIGTIKTLVSEKGIDVVDTKFFVNVLDDLGAFRGEPAASKKVMRGLMDAGFGALVVKIAKNKDSNWQNVVRKAVADFSSKSGYKDELINSISFALISGAGILNDRPKAQATPLTRRTGVRPSIDKNGSMSTVGKDKGNVVTQKKPLVKRKKSGNGLHWLKWIFVIIGLCFIYFGALKWKAKRETDRIVAEWYMNVITLKNSNQLVQAKRLTLALPESLVLKGKTERTCRYITQQIDILLSEQAATMYVKFLNEIYENDGRLSEQSKQELNEIIEVLPDNYWLNIIKEKTE